MNETYADCFDLLSRENPVNPVYAIYPRVYRHNTQRFLGGFPGRTLYAVKANPHPAILSALSEAGVADFDCASFAEIEHVHRHVAGARCYFMNPARLPGDARKANARFGVRHFVVDDYSGLAALAAELDLSACVVFARMAVSHASAVFDLSAKFGALPAETPALMIAIRETGAEPALAFNVGSGVSDPAAYRNALRIARSVLAELPFAVRQLDVGGGFPISYPDYSVPPFEAFFDSLRDAASDLPLADGAEMLAEPGRALSAPGLSAVTRVLLRKPDRVYLNDGMYGGFWELRFGAPARYACRAVRDGRELAGDTATLRVFGPTCDSNDVLPAPVPLPADIRAGDFIEFGSIGAYSLSGRSDFNGFGDFDVVTFTNAAAIPPGA